MLKLPDAWEVFNFTQSEVYNKLFSLYSVWSVSAAEVTRTLRYYRVFCFRNPIQSSDGDCKLKVDAKRNDI